MFNFPALPRELQILICNAAFDACFNNRRLIISYYGDADSRGLTEKLTQQSHNACNLARKLAMTNKLFLQTYGTFFVPRIHHKYYLRFFTLELPLFNHLVKSHIFRVHAKHTHMVDVIFNWWGMGHFVVEAGLDQIRDGKVRHMVRYHARWPTRARERVCKAEEAGECHIEAECWVKIEKRGDLVLDHAFVLI